MASVHALADVCAAVAVAAAVVAFAAAGAIAATLRALVVHPFSFLASLEFHIHFPFPIRLFFRRLLLLFHARSGISGDDTCHL